MREDSHLQRLHHAFDSLMQTQVDAVFVFRRALEQAASRDVRESLAFLLQDQRDHLLTVTRAAKKIGIKSTEGALDEGLSALRTAWLQTRIALSGATGDRGLLLMAVTQARRAERASSQCASAGMPPETGRVLRKVCKALARHRRLLERLAVERIMRERRRPRESTGTGTWSGSSPR